MSFTTVQLFKQISASTLQSYCKYSIWQPKYYEIAKQLEKELINCDSKESVLEKLYKVYCDLLQKNSKDVLVGKLSLLIADELDVDRKQVSKYHSSRAFAIETSCGKLICNKNIPERTVVSMGTWSYDEYKCPEQKDPLVTAYEARKLQPFFAGNTHAVLQR